MAGLVAADVLAVLRWWLEERQLVLACQLIKIAVQCLPAGNSSQIEGFQRNLKVLKCHTSFLRL